MPNEPLKTHDVLRDLYPISANEAVTFGNGLDVYYYIHNMTPLDDQLLNVGKLDYQIGADVEKLMEKTWVAVAVQFLVGDVPISNYE